MKKLLVILLLLFPVPGAWADIEVKLPPTEAEKKYKRILNACLTDKGVGLDRALIRALRATCVEIASDPSWFESFKYDK